MAGCRHSGLRGVFMTEHPRVSVVLVNFKGAADTLTAIDALAALPEYPAQLEIVVVDNASGDDSVVRLKDSPYEFVLVESETNSGFAGGCNLGVSRSTGDIVAFLNSDAKPDSLWVSAALASFDTHESVGAVASQVVDWEGKKIDYQGSGLTWYGMGYRPFTGDKTSKKKAQKAAPVLFGTGAAMFVHGKSSLNWVDLTNRFSCFLKMSILDGALTLRVDVSVPTGIAGLSPISRLHGRCGALSGAVFTRAKRAVLPL